MGDWTPTALGVLLTIALPQLFNGICSVIAARRAGAAQTAATGAQTTCERVETQSDTRGQLVASHLADLKSDTKEVRSQTNGTSRDLMQQNRDLLMQMNSVLLQNAELKAVVGALQTEVAGLKTQRMGGRSTDPKPVLQQGSSA